MKSSWGSTINFLAVFVALLLFAGFQSTFWFQIFKSIPAPLLWLNVLVYMMLYRKTLPAALGIYLLSYSLLAFSSVSLRMMWVPLILVFVIVYVIKTRVFWSGSGYFTLMSAIAVGAFNIFYFLGTIFIEKKPASFELMDRILQMILTPTFAVPTYWVLNKIDELTLDEFSRDSGRLEL